MSRLGKMLIELQNGTQVKKEGGFIVVNGAKGELKIKDNSLVKVDIEEKQVKVSVENKKNKKEKSIWGLYRSLINNMVIGVNEGYEKKLEINGVGYKANISDNKLILNVGYSNPVEFKIADGITISVEGNIISVNGIDKQQVGNVAAHIRKIRKPEPYKGKGIKYIDEIIRRKVGKAATKSE